MKTSKVRAFTLTELLVVVAIMGLLAALSIPAMQSMAGAGKFNQAVSGIAGLFELARSQAIAQNTYTWVVLYQTDPSKYSTADNNSGNEVFATAYLSNDGTDPFAGGTATAATFPAGTVPGATTLLIPITRFLNFKQTSLVLDSSVPLPNISTNNVYATNAPNFQYSNFKVGNGVTTTLGSSGTAIKAYGIVEFTPSGAARISSSLVESIWLGLYPLKGKTTSVSSNVASLRINGLTGLVTVYRK